MRTQPEEILRKGLLGASSEPGPTTRSNSVRVISSSVKEWSAGMKTLLPVLGVWPGFASWPSATVMGELAAQRQPGTWAQLNAGNLPALFDTDVKSCQPSPNS